MQDAIKKMENLGPIPSYDDATEEILLEYAQLLKEVKRPVSNDDAMALIRLFSPDDIGGVNWTIIALVETAPDWPLKSYLEAQPKSEDIDRLIKRAKNAGLWDQGRTHS